MATATKPTLCGGASQHGEGPIVPLLMPEHDYDLTRLVHERTVSINTAAAGGNASLMTIGN